MAPAVDPYLLDTAVELARLAGELTMLHFRTTGLQIDEKDDGTPVTIADRAAERRFREEIGHRFPDDGIFGEEEPEHVGTSGRRWVIDPIDGTKAFSHGVPTFCNLVALEDEHGIAAGVINLPALGETVYAGRGLGCFSNGVPARVRHTPSVAGAYLTSSGYGGWADPMLLSVKHAGMHLRTWGDGWGYALLATGRVDAMVDPIAEFYDLAPMPVIVAEAGGRFTDLDGVERADGGHGVATTGAIHDEVLGLLQPGR